jgi:alpha-tubulin suppressor-like RCC1 family protein
VGTGAYSTKACGVVSDGRLYCWGDARDGSLGTGDALSHPDPTLVGTGFVSVATASSHGCGLDAAGALRCWGTGACTPGNQLAPARCGSGTWKAVATGWQYTCAIAEGGDLLCWGADGYGQLGDGGSAHRLTPDYVSTVAVTGTAWTSVAATLYTTCGLRDDASLWCWGANWQGQLGDGSNTTRRTPVSPGGAWKTVSIASSSACGVKTAGTLWCWGAPFPGTGAGGSSPQQVGAESDWAGVSAGAAHVCAWKASGVTRCWGENQRGQLATGSAANVNDGAPAISSARIASAGYTSCAITTAGELRCWGSNDGGMVGVGEPGSRSAPVRIAPDRTFTSVGVSNDVLCAVSGGVRHCAGMNRWGGFGDGTQAGSATLRAAGSETDWTVISVGQGFGLGLRGAGALAAWGSSDYRWGNGSSLDPAVVLSTTTPWQLVDAGLGYALAIAPDGRLLGWGNNSVGQLGDGTTTYRTQPVEVSGGGTWTFASAFDSSSCGIRTDGTLWCWGPNASGQLGTGNVDPSLVPTQVGTSAGWTRVAVRNGKTCGIRGGALYCWGSGYAGTPQPVAAGTTFDHVVMGTDHACALASGTLRCWGFNAYGQLGIGTYVNAATPTQVGTASDWTAVALGWDATCGLRNGGELWCWGSNDGGTLGDGTGFYAAPQAVGVPAFP